MSLLDRVILKTARGGVLQVQRQARIDGADLVRRGKPVFEWIPVWESGGEFAGCECRGGPPEDRCDRKWIRCNGRLAEQRRRIKAILAYQDPSERAASVTEASP